MGEAVLAQALHDVGRDHIRVNSAGLNALVGYPPHYVAQRLMRERGIDISAHRARQVTTELISWADLILVMEMEQKKLIEAWNPSVRGKVYRLGEWSNFDVQDPLGQPDEVFERVLLLIDKGIADWIPKLKGSKS